MEIESDHGDKIHLNLNADAPTVIGRDSGLRTNDRTVSRRHISLKLHSGDEPNSKPRVSFEVIGKNPVWVRSGEDGGIRVFRKGEECEFGVGDEFCVSGKKHVWLRLNSGDASGSLKTGSGIGGVEDESLETVSDLEFEGVDVSEIDPVKEFGFLVMGHEFDNYGNKLTRDTKNWRWFLEDPKKESDDEDAVGKTSQGKRRKRTKGKWDDQGDDDEWEGESDEDKELISKTKKVPRPNYSTRSKDRGKSTKSKGKKISKKSTPEASTASEEEMDDADEDEDDETLGGFIVDSEEVADDAASEDEEEEEEFEDDEDLDD